MYRKSKQFYVLVIILFFFSAHIYAQDNVIISEFMAVNNNVIQDEDSVYSDWIEIYNSGPSDVNLTGWYLTDNSNELMKWLFPSVIINADEYLVVFASGKDRKSEKDKLHTNFKLSGSGEYLALVKPGGIQIATEFSSTFPVQFPNISYGENQSGYTYFADPTPGSENIGAIYILPPKFSVEHGFYEDAFSLELSVSTDSAEIYYTTDASAPDKFTGINYTSPILIDSTIVIRAIAVKEGVGSSGSITQSYIFPESVLHQSESQPGYPATWLSPIHGTADYFEIPSNYSMQSAFLAKPEVNKVIIQSLKSLPVVSIVSNIENLFSKNTDPDSGGIYMYNGEPDGPTINMLYHLGRDWARPASIEYFNSGADDGSIDLQANCIIKIHGGATRTRAKTEKHSFKIGFTSEYGPAKLEKQMFGPQSPVQYDWLVLRGGFAPRLGLQVRDPWAKSTMRDMGQYAAFSKFVHVYLNGLYWGMYNLSEQMDENCMRDNLGGKAGDYDILKDYLEIEAGDTLAWTELVELSADSIMNPDNYQKIMGNNPDGTPNPSYGKLLNPENFIDYIMMNMYAGTSDWDYHNWAAARRKNDSEGFHFLVWDAESVFNGDNVNNIVLRGMYNRPSGIFSDLLKYDQFKDQFISRVNKHLFEGGALTPSLCYARYKKWHGVIDTALISDQARWVWSNDIWNTNYHSFINSYFPSRTENVFKQFISNDLYPYIDPPVFNTTDKIISQDFQLLMNSPTGGDILYTLDGKDPGYLAPDNQSSVKIYNGTPIPFSNDTIRVMARVKKDSLWSILVNKQFIIEDYVSVDPAMLTHDDNYFNIYPNPINEFTTIKYFLTEPSYITLKVYNVMGEYIATLEEGEKQEGLNIVNWDSGRLPKGIYFCILENKNNATIKRIKVLKS